MDLEAQRRFRRLPRRVRDVIMDFVFENPRVGMPLVASAAVAPYAALGGAAYGTWNYFDMVGVGDSRGRSLRTVSQRDNGQMPIVPGHPMPSYMQPGMLPPPKKRKTNESSYTLRTPFGGLMPIRRIGRKKHRKLGTVAKLKKQVKKLSRSMPKDAKVTFSFITGLYCNHAINTCEYAYTEISRVSNFEAVLDSVDTVSYTTPAAPTLVGVNVTALAPPMKYKFNVYAKLTLRNNGNTSFVAHPVECRLYVVACKQPTSTTPLAILQDSTQIAKQQAASAGTALVYSQPVYYPSDNPKFLEYYKILKTYSFRLEPGSDVSFPYSETFWYEPDVYDESASNFHPDNSRFFVLRTEGVPCHDSATSAIVGLSGGQVDMVCERKFSMHHEALVPLVTKEISNTLGSVGAAPIVLVSDMN